MSLTEFLKARFDEDEAVARRRIEAGHCVWPILGTGEARALAECEAKRRIVRRAHAASDAASERGLDDRAWAIRRASADSWRLALSDLALPYADHPDYQQEWAS